MSASEIKITLIYDNTVWLDSLEPDWGFSCLVEAFDTSILFDTGTHSRILLDNMNKLDINPEEIDMVFISHDHWDHVDGLTGLSEVNPNLTIYCPSSFSGDPAVKEVIKIENAVEIRPNIYSTGELDGIEQSLVIKSQNGVTVVTGCSHPGVGTILEASSKIGPVKNLIGGLHEFSDLPALEPLEKICATHCTQYINEIKEWYPEKVIEGGAGRIINF